MLAPNTEPLLEGFGCHIAEDRGQMTEDRLTMQMAVLYVPSSDLWYLKPPSTRNALPDDIDVNVIRMVGNYFLISLFAFLGLSQFVVKSA